MTFIECCKNCKHCIPGRASVHGWCSLRKIKVHPELAQVLFCHHWIQTEPTLPRLEERQTYLDRQLDFGKALANLDN